MIPLVRSSRRTPGPRALDVMISPFSPVVDPAHSTSHKTWVPAYAGMSGEF